MPDDRRHNIPRNTNEIGQAALMVTFGSIFLFGVLGLVMDVGYGYFLKQVAQSAADSAAMAGATMAMNSGAACGTVTICQSDTACPADPTYPPSTDFDAACLYAKANGFPTTATQRMIMSAGTNTPPVNSGVAVNYWITATASKTQPLTFLRVLGFNSAAITAQATSGVVPSNAAGGCIWVLDKVVNSAFNEGGSGHIQANCGILVNSNSTSALNVQGSATLSVSSMKVVGGAVLANNANVSPIPITGAPAVEDPFAKLPAPTYSGCDYMNMQPHGTVTLSPGVYCGGIKVSSGSTITFNPGVYVLNGGGMMVSSSNASLNGTEVSFFNTSNGYAFGAVTITGGATVNFTAPRSGTYKGVLFFQDRNMVSSATSAIGGGANQNYTGSIYMPTASLNFVGGSQTHALTTALIVKNINISGDAYLQRDETGELIGIPQTVVALVQ